ncbi:MAG: hypothetical protein J7M26_01240 [Armatimonadetes bacterium]|nr:hypothetical protein [Armatimonadota bacterium]
MVVAAFALTVAPWLVRNYLVLHTLGQPLQHYELVMHTRNFPGHNILWDMRGAQVNPFTFALTHPGQTGLKFVQGLVSTYRALPNIVSPYLWPFLALGYFLVRQNSLRARVCKTVGLLALIQVSTTSLYDISDTRRVYVLVPLAWGLALAAAMQFGRKYVPTVRGRWTLAVVLGVLVFFPYLTGAWLGGKLPQTPSVKNLGIIAHAVDPDDLIASDVAWAVAWYAQRRAMLLPGSLQQLKRLAEMKYEPSYISVAVHGRLAAIRPPTAGLGGPAEGPAQAAGFGTGIAAADAGRRAAH